MGMAYNRGYCMLCELGVTIGLALVCLYVLCEVGYCKDLINLQAVSFVESSCNPKAINRADNGGIGSYGLHQVSPFALIDYNKAHRTYLKPSDLLKAETSTKVADWYLNREIPRLLRHFKQKDNLLNRLTAYNMGIGAVIKGRVAKAYHKKYLRALKQQKGGRYGV